MNKLFLKIIFFYSLVFLGGACKSGKLNPLKKNFPVTELKAQKLPSKNNLWVFVLAGQSNMAGRGFVEPPDTIPSSRIFSINKANEIILAKEPLHFYEPSLTGLDCGISFGRELIKSLPDSISILLIPTAVGGSTISQWLGDSLHKNVQLFSNFSARTAVAKSIGTFKGILWHQGENDALNDSDINAYKSRLSQLFIRFRETTGVNNLPVFIGKLGDFSAENQHKRNLINEQITAYSQTDSNAIVIETKGLKDKGDKLHFNAEAQRMLGKRMAEAFNVFLKKQ